MDGFSHQLDELKALDYVNLANCLIKAYVKFLYCSYFLGEKFSIKQLGRAGLKFGPSFEALCFNTQSQFNGKA